MENQFKYYAQALFQTLLVVVLFAACSEKEEAPFIKSSDAGTTITAESNNWAGWSTIVQSNLDMSELAASSSAAWCTAKLSSNGGSNYQLQVSAEDNPTLSARQATITVKSTDGQASVSFMLNQQAGKPYVSFKDGETDITISSEAKEWEQVLDSNIGFSKLSATSSEKWLTAKLESTGSGILLKLSAAANRTIAERKATVTIKAATGSVNTSFTVSQEADGPSISFKEGGEDQTITPDGKSWSWGISTNLTYADLVAVSDAGWCTAELTGSDSKGISLSVKVAKNQSIVERKAAVTVKSNKYGTSLAFNVTQQAGAPTIQFTGNEGKDQKIAAPKKEWDWTVQSNVAYGDIKVTSNESWCQVKLANSSDATDMKTYKLTTTVAEDPMDKSRQAVVTISSTKYNLSVQYLITQEAATFTQSHKSLGYDRDGGSRTVTITSNASWQAVCDANWITLEQNGKYLTVRVKSTTTDRSATITFKDKSGTTITVRQSIYKVGEAFTGDNAGGTVVYIGDDRRLAAKKLSSAYRWCEGYAYTVVGCSSRTNGKSNTQKVHNQSSWRGNYPAFKAIDDLGSEWYMPAVDEINDLGSFASGVFWTSTEEAVATYNAYLSSGFDEKQNTHTVIAVREF